METPGGAGVPVSMRLGGRRGGVRGPAVPRRGAGRRTGFVGRGAGWDAGRGNAAGGGTRTRVITAQGWF